MERERVHVGAGVVAALVGYTSSFAVVLTGLRAVGATSSQAATGLMVLCLAQSVVMAWLIARHHLPLVVVWSTPGAALLATTGEVDGGWAAAVGAFAVAGGLYVLTGLWPWLGRTIARIPAPVAQAMLAGVVLQLCLAPVQGAIASPWAVLPVVAVWVVGARLVPRWAVPAAFVAAAVVIAIDLTRRGEGVDPGALLPGFDLTTPHLTWAALVGIALPLYVVTMASQNVPGVAIMRSFDVQVPWRDSLVSTGLATAVTAPAGGHSLNLAAISAALVAGPDGGADPARRWRTARWAAVSFVVLGLASSAIAAFVTQAPQGLVATVAGLALLGTLTAALRAATEPEHTREAAIITFLVAASGITIVGVGAAFWAVVAGLVVHAAFRKEDA